MKPHFGDTENKEATPTGTEAENGHCNRQSQIVWSWALAVRAVTSDKDSRYANKKVNKRKFLCFRTARNLFTTDVDNAEDAHFSSASRFTRRRGTPSPVARHLPAAADGWKHCPKLSRRLEKGAEAEQKTRGKGRAIVKQRSKQSLAHVAPFAAAVVNAVSFERSLPGVLHDRDHISRKQSRNRVAAKPTVSQRRKSAWLRQPKLRIRCSLDENVPHLISGKQSTSIHHYPDIET